MPEPYKNSRVDSFLQKNLPGLYKRRAEARFKGLQFDHAAKTYRALQSNRADRPNGNTIPKRDQDIMSSRDRNFGIAKVRDLRRGNGIFAGLMMQFGVNCVGLGVKPSPSTTNPEYNVQADAMFTNWGDNPLLVDERGQFSLWDYQFNLLIAALSEGDMFTLMNPSSGKIRGLEADRIDTPSKFLSSEGKSICQGVQYETNSERQQRIWVGAQNQFGHMSHNMQDWRSYPWWQYHQSANMDRFSQFRGISPSLPSLDSIQSLEEIISSALISWKAQQSFALALFPGQTDAPPAPLAPKNGPAAPGSTQDPNAPGAGSGAPRIDLTQRGAEIIDLKAYGSGDMKVIQAGSVSAEFEQFTKIVSRVIGLPFGLPFDIVLLDVHQGNFSSQRMAFRMAYKSFLHWWKIVRNFSQRIYNWKINEFIQSGQLKVPANVSNPFACRWTPPLQEMLDPQKEITAMLLSEAGGYSNKEENARALGSDLQTNLNKTEEITKNFLDKKILMPSIPIPGALSVQEVFAGINQKIAITEKNNRIK